jgi:hypothetical protein
MALLLDADEGALLVYRGGTVDALPQPWPVVDEEGRLNLDGGVRHHYQSVDVTDSPYAATLTDRIIGVDTSIAPVTVELPAVAELGEGVVLLIKDEGGKADVESIIVEAVPGEKIDGADSVTMTTAYESLRLYSGATNWFIAARLT